MSVSLDAKDDDELMALAARGSQEALAELYERYRTRVMGYALRLTGDRALAEDIFQNTFLYLFEHLDRYEPRGRFAGYLFRIARSFATDEQAAARRAREPVPLPLGEHLFTTPPAEEAGETEEAALAERKTREAIRQLPDHLREVLELRLYQGLDYAEVASVTGVSEATCRSRMRYALEALKTSLGIDRQSGPRT